MPFTTSSQEMVWSLFLQPQSLHWARVTEWLQHEDIMTNNRCNWREFR